MSETIVFGKGMIGKALGRMIPGTVRFIDNSDGTVEEAVKEKPDKIILGVLDEERQNQMISQLKQLGFEGKIVTYPRIIDNRVATLRLLAPQIPEGAVAELGVYKGDFAEEISRALPKRRMHLFDSFKGFDGMFTDTSAESVRKRLPEAEIHEGYFPGTFVPDRYAFVSLDADLYEPTLAGLTLFWENMEKNGVFMIHDYNSSQFPGVKKAVDEFCAEKNLIPFPVCDLHGSVVLRK